METILDSIAVTAKNLSRWDRKGTYKGLDRVPSEDDIRTWARNWIHPDYVRLLEKQYDNLEKLRGT